MLLQNMKQKLEGGASSGGGGGGRKRDVVVEVAGYNLDAGTIDVKEPNPEGARDYTVQISRFAPKPTRPDADFEGNAVDKRMEAMFPPGSKIILEGLIDYGPGNDKPLPASWISSVPQNEAKLVSGVLSASGYVKDGERKIAAVQEWLPKAQEPEAVLKRLDLFDQSANYAKESRESYQEGNPMPVKPSAGFALRAVQDGEVVDFTPAIAYNPETKLPPSAADVKESIEFYQKDVAERFPNAKVEVALFREYPASNELPAKGPIGTMAFTPGRMSIDGEMPRYGNSVVAGEGLLKLSTGKLMNNGKRRGEENDWANNVLVSSAKHHVHELVKDAQGERLKVSEQLDINYPRQRAEAPAPEAKQEEKSEPPKATSEDEGMDAALKQASAMSNKGPSQ